MLSCMWDSAKNSCTLSTDGWQELSIAFSQVLKPRLDILRARSQVAAVTPNAAGNMSLGPEPIVVEVCGISGDMLQKFELPAGATVGFLREALTKGGIEGSSLLEGGRIISEGEVLDDSHPLSWCRSKPGEMVRLSFIRDGDRYQEVLGLRDLCNSALVQLGELSLAASSGSDRVFCMRMQADCHRFLAETCDGDRRASAVAKARKLYISATAIAEHELPWCDAGAWHDGKLLTNAPRLALALNYGVFLNYILHDHEEACKVSREAFEGAIAELDHLDGDDEHYADLMLMQKLRDNLTTWTSDEKGDFAEA
eukprot:TRINITY_DN113641_c0_g1_i1.p1 TRINITY_DN113641_c0_g1~~TRINITY_DN113641_c0_g1_i1.p1  ORF type:complete len:341 (-),score=47.26 TRINITY_DN113641_c0_g1_i1:75-1007(-)